MSFKNNMKSAPGMNRYHFLQLFSLFYRQTILWKVGSASEIPIEPPSIITAYNTSSLSINVTWGWHSSDYQSKHSILGYKLTYREANLTNEMFHLLCILQSSAELTKLEVYTTYCVEIASFTDRIVSNRSRCLLVTTDEEPPNAPPQNFTAFSISSTGIRVTWDPLPVENRRGIILGYRLFWGTGDIQSHNHVKRRSSSVEELETEANVLSKDLVGLEKFTNYCVWAKAFNSKGNSHPTNYTCTRTDEDVPSHPPVSISAHNTSSTNLSVEWEAIPTEFIHGMLLGYKVFYGKTSEPPSQYKTLKTDQLRISLTNLEKFTEYCVQLAGFTRIGDGNKSRCFNVTTDEDVPSAAPQPAAQSFYSKAAIIITWDLLPASVSHGIVLGYEIHVKEVTSDTSPPEDLFEEMVLTKNASQTSFRFGNLSLATKYQVQMAAYTSKGVGPLSDLVYASLHFAVPSHPPVSISAHNTSSTSLSVGWEAIPTEFIHGMLLGYKVFYGKTSEPPSQYKTLKTDQLRISLTNLEKFTEYCVQLAGFTRIGDGNKSRCFNVTTDENVPSAAPQPAAQSFYSKAAIIITWDLLPASVSHGIVLGYEIHVKEVTSDTNPPEDLFEEMVLIENASQTSFRFGNLSLASKYQVQMAAYTSKGVGPLSDQVYAETCRCLKRLSTFKSPSSLDKGGPGGIGEVIGNAIIESCGYCEEHGKSVLVFTSVDDGESNVRFPVEVTSPRGSDFSKFVPVLEVPGVLIIKRRDGSTQRFSEEVMTSSVLDTWPIIAVSLLMIYFAGVIVWFLDRKENPDDLSRNFIKGAYEGFWWSFITMTTVGYGDRCPKSFSARAFAIIWLLVSMVLFTFFIGTISSILTVTVMRSRTTVVHSGGNKAAAIANSSEAKLALGSLSSKLKLTKTYPTAERLAQSLKEGEVDYILVDMYLPVKRRDLFNGSWFEIEALLKTEVFHGIILQGDALKLASKLEEMIANNNVQTKFLADSNTEEDPTEVESNESLFFDPSSPFFQHILFASLGALGLFLICGVLYEVFFFKPRIHLNCVNVTEREKTRRELESLVEEFCHSLKKIYEILRKRHRKELLELVRQKRTGRKTRNAERADIPMETSTNNQLLHVRFISSKLI